MLCGMAIKRRAASPQKAAAPAAAKPYSIWFNVEQQRRIEGAIASVGARAGVNVTLSEWVRSAVMRAVDEEEARGKKG